MRRSRSWEVFHSIQSGTNLVDVADYYYDSSDTTTNGIGDSNLTLLVAHVDTTGYDDQGRAYQSSTFSVDQSNGFTRRKIKGRESNSSAWRTGAERGG